jgi:hypothetical protein
VDCYWKAELFQEITKLFQENKITETYKTKVAKFMISREKTITLNALNNLLENDVINSRHPPKIIQKSFDKIGR